MALIRCAQADLPDRQQKDITSVIHGLYDSILENYSGVLDQEGDDLSFPSFRVFVCKLKSYLHAKYTPHWHVIVGKSLGYACKKRDGTVGVWHVIGGRRLSNKNKLTLVVWKSPAIELPSLDAGVRLQSETSAQDAKGTFRVLLPPLAAIEVGSDIESATHTLKEICYKYYDKPPTELAKLIRSRLTAKIGTIWHVAVGRDFIIDHAEDARNSVLATFARDDRTLKIACFQHEQSEGRRIDWQKLFLSLPYLMIVLACFAYMGIQSVCASGTSSASASSKFNVAARMVETWICARTDWESEVGCATLGIIASSFMTKRLIKGS